jgi:hypothetical protein
MQRVAAPGPIRPSRTSRGHIVSTTTAGKAGATHSIAAIIMPVLEAMPPSHIKHELLRAFPLHAMAFRDIEDSFATLTSARQDADRLRRFFQSWSQTNNSAMTVAGISNRLTLAKYRSEPMRDETALLRAIVSLNRIVDEDLAVTNAVLHSQMFYAMATDIVGDDLWLLHRYLHDSARAFKAWKDRNSLRENDPMIALLTTLVHEIYTHGEVEFILPMFRRWLEVDYGRSRHDTTRTLAWISVHCGPTEKNHFFHALDAVEHYARARGLLIEDYSLAAIVETYLQKKAAVMRALYAIDTAVAA